MTALTRGVSYPGTTATTDPRRRRRDDDDDATRTRRRERKTFHSRRASPRFASRPIARATSVPSSSLIIAHHRARGARYAATHPSPRTARATRFTPARARGRIERIETRTWTLVALKAATRPTKEEARSADIIVVSECWNDDRVDRSRGVDRVEDDLVWFGFGFVHTDRDFVSSSMGVPWCIRACVRRIQLHGDWIGFEGYTLVACGHHMFGRVVSSDAHPEARDDWSRERDDDARGETRERGDDRDRWFVRVRVRVRVRRARAREAAVRLERGRRVRSFVRSSVATVLNRLRRRSSTRASETRSIEARGARNRGGWRRDARGGMNFARRWRRVEREG